LRVGLGGEARVGFLVAEDPGLALGHDVVPELRDREVVAPRPEAALGELHDVALVDEGDALALS
jgi:hypothetical protein